MNPNLRKEFTIQNMLDKIYLNTLRAILSCQKLKNYLVTLKPD